MENETVEALTGVAMPASVHAHSGETHETVTQPIQDSGPLPNAPNQNGIVSVSPGEVLDVDDLSGEPRWYWSKDTPGDGDRPDWLPENQTVEDLARRASGLRKQISQIKHAPEEYTVNIDPEISEYFNISEDDPTLNEFKNIALGADISQEGFNEILNMYMEHQAEAAIAEMDRQEAECEILGIDPTETYNRLSTWADNNLPPDSAEIMKGLSLTAPQMKVMTDIINKFAGSNNLPGYVDTGSFLTDDDRRSKLGELMNKGGINYNRRMEELYPEIKNWRK